MFPDFPDEFPTNLLDTGLPVVKIRVTSPVKRGDAGSSPAGGCESCRCSSMAERPLPGSLVPRQSLGSVGKRTIEG